MSTLSLPKAASGIIFFSLPTENSVFTPLFQVFAIIKEDGYAGFSSSLAET
jgi:hypothetical protein